MRIVAQNAQGFTLVELLMVVSIIAALSGFLIPGFSTYIDNQNVLQAQELLKNDLRTAQNRALTGVGTAVGTSFWGIKVVGDNANDYLLFSSAADSAAACNSVSSGGSGVTRSEPLPGRVVVRGSNGACVFFSTRNGDATIVNNPSGDTLRVAYTNESPCHGVQINAVGMMRGLNLCE